MTTDPTSNRRARIVAAIKSSPFDELRTVDHAPNGPLQITVRVDDLADTLMRALAAAPVAVTADLPACDCEAEVHIGTGFYHQRQCATRTVPVVRPELRDQIAALFRHPPGAERLGDATPGEIADAVLSVLPATTNQAAEEAYRLALSTALRLGTGANWEAIRDRAEDLVAEVGQLDEASRRLLEQRQEMAAERFAWQERGDRAETRVRQMEADATTNRAAVLREAGWAECSPEWLAAHPGQCGTAPRVSGGPTTSHWHPDTTLLRRMAVEAQQQTEPRPVARIVNPQTGVGFGTGGNQPAVVAAVAGEAHAPRSDVGTEFVHQVDNPDKAALDLWETDLAQSGVSTPGCDCGHDGMGVRWHDAACAWKVGLVAEARQLLTAEEPATEAPAVCEGFQWIGQSFATCDRCARPAWEHVGEDVPVEGAGPFDNRRTVRPWGPGEADRIRAKWAPTAVSQPAEEN